MELACHSFPRLLNLIPRTDFRDVYESSIMKTKTVDERIFTALRKHIQPFQIMGVERTFAQMFFEGEIMVADPNWIHTGYDEDPIRFILDLRQRPALQPWASALMIYDFVGMFWILRASRLAWYVDRQKPLNVDEHGMLAHALDRFHAASNDKMKWEHVTGWLASGGLDNNNNNNNNNSNNTNHNTIHNTNQNTNHNTNHNNTNHNSTNHNSTNHNNTNHNNTNHNNTNHNNNNNNNNKTAQDQNATTSSGQNTGMEIDMNTNAEVYGGLMGGMNRLQITTTMDHLCHSLVNAFRDTAPSANSGIGNNRHDAMDVDN
ncbi:hypothetical protein B0T17DRAFT_150737 [Bombardia bombarda]|uniref:Uncharacterized protein n=1 Tax=Bombardia bombarda TaxID=252184 RepID=A0AA39X712_9PEZI|nr:hypothetical protein B0T17DRAFT_150737 [Bombardia bombarda]